VASAADAVAPAADPAAADAVAPAAGSAAALDLRSLDAGDDPRLRHTGREERLVRAVGDLVFSRPIHFVRWVAGIGVLPVALPIAALFADWRDAVDICVIGPYRMTFARPLGE